MTLRGGPFANVNSRVSHRRACKMLDHLGLENVEVSIALVDDAAIRLLNEQYRGLDRPTDVLAFAMREGDHASVAHDENGAELLGDVVISVETALRQAKQQKRPLLDELTMLLAHGLLHLLGYDHDTAAKERVMLQKTRELELAAKKRARRSSN